MLRNNPIPMEKANNFSPHFWFTLNNHIFIMHTKNVVEVLRKIPLRGLISVFVNFF